VDIFRLFIGSSCIFAHYQCSLIVWTRISLVTFQTSILRQQWAPIGSLRGLGSYPSCSRERYGVPRPTRSKADRGWLIRPTRSEVLEPEMGPIDQFSGIFNGLGRLDRESGPRPETRSGVGCNIKALNLSLTSTRRVTIFIYCYKYSQGGPFHQR
jgi:hypothetical protein